MLFFLLIGSILPQTNWIYAIRFQTSITLEALLEDMTRIEVLTDCMCRKCSLLATHRRLQDELKRVTTADESDNADGSITQSKKKRIREARKLETRVGALLADGRIEEDLKGLKMERVLSRASTKQVMIARVRSSVSALSFLKVC